MEATSRKNILSLGPDEGRPLRIFGELATRKVGDEALERMERPDGGESEGGSGSERA